MSTNYGEEMSMGELTEALQLMLDDSKMDLLKEWTANCSMPRLGEAYTYNLGYRTAAWFVQRVLSARSSSELAALKREALK